MDKDDPAGKSPRTAREDMPAVTAWIDALRAAFGKEQIDAAIKRGLIEGTFWAMENGRVIGEPSPEAQQRIEKEWAGAADRKPEAPD